MSIQFGNVKILLIGIALTALIYLGRLILCKALIKRNTPLSEAAMISFIIPKGLAAAVLAEVPMHMGLSAEIETIFIEIRAIIYMVILFSILLTAFLIYGYESGLIQSRYEQLFKKTDG